MLHNETCTATSNYSKVLRGLRFPLGISGLHTRMLGSGDSNPGQWKPRYAIHASRQSNDKVLRYLKRIIVIPAVYLLLAPLEGGLKYRHWADVAFHTNLFRLAESGVFVKQTGPPR